MNVLYRGSGSSCADDYDPPHSVQTATEDVITLIQTICPEHYVQQPCAVVGVGVLGGALARCYYHMTSSKGAVTTKTHSEISGFGSVTAPKYLLLLEKLQESVIKETVKNNSEIATLLQVSAKEYSQQYAQQLEDNHQYFNHQRDNTTVHTLNRGRTVLNCYSESHVVDFLSYVV